MHIKVISFTQSGAKLAKRVRQVLPENLVQIYARGTDRSLNGTILARLVQQAMYDCEALVFIGAAGIAVRAIAPYLRSKTEDPAVVVLDEDGRFAVPILSGHLGGANELAMQLAAVLDAQAVLTTATDVRGAFAVDSWAKSRGYTVADAQEIRWLSAAVLRDEQIGMISDFSVRGEVPACIKVNGEAESGFVLSVGTTQQPFPHTLHLIAPAVVAGIGCRRGKSREEIVQVLEEALTTAGVDPRALTEIATIDLKKNEPGLRQLAAEKGLPLVTFSAETLSAVKGDFTASVFVQGTVGVDNVCERAAVCASGGRLLSRKLSKNGVTVALALLPLEVMF